MNVRLSLMPYDGTPKVKQKCDRIYTYIRKRVSRILTLTYVGVYTDELYNLLLKNAKEVRENRKCLREVEKNLLH